MGKIMTFGIERFDMSYMNKRFWRPCPIHWLSQGKRILNKILVFDWLHYVGQNHFYVMMLIKQGCCYFQSLHFSYVLQENFVQNSRQ